MALDGVPSIRVHSGKDFMGGSKFIRWTQVFIIKVNYLSPENLIVSVFKILYTFFNDFLYVVRRRRHLCQNW